MAKFPETDPTPIFEYFRGIHGTELLTAAVAHFGLFEHLAEQSLPWDELRARLQLAERPFVVLTTALRAMKLLSRTARGCLELTTLASEHLVPGAPYDVTGYIGLAAKNPSVVEMVERLRTNRPRGAENCSEGTAFIFREGTASAMDDQAAARQLTLSLAGRARNVAPHLVERLRLKEDGILLDVGGGSGIYSFALLQKYPRLRVAILDRAEVLKVAEECAHEWQVLDRVEFLAGDMFNAPYPAADTVLLSNVLHDWDVPECELLIRRAAETLKPDSQVVIHDVFLNDGLDGPLPVALYSAALYSLTEGRAYSGMEFRSWLKKAGRSHNR